MTEAEKKINEDIAKMDLYKILGVSHDASEKAIVKGYRKLALKYHPDKNPDNPSAVEMFHKLSKALEILTDKAAKAAYDKIQQARHAAELRRLELDSKRRKLRDDLESREKAATQDLKPDVNAKANLEAEILRLRKEGNRLLQEEQERLKEQLKKGATDEQSDEEDVAPRLKIKWKARKGDPDNGGYSEDVLTNMFHKYGDIAALVLSSKKGGSAIIEFTTSRGAQLAYDNETGLQDNPVSITWLSGQPKKSSIDTMYSNNVSEKDTRNTGYMKSNTTEGGNLVSGFSFNTCMDGTQDNTPSDSINDATNGNSGNFNDSAANDFESLVLMRMKQAQERKRLAEQITEEENEDDR